MALPHPQLRAGGRGKECSRGQSVQDAKQQECNGFVGRLREFRNTLPERDSLLVPLVEQAGLAARQQESCWSYGRESLEAKMALEFRTRDLGYPGPRVFPSGTAIQQASAFVDQLPPGFATDHYHLHIVKDEYSHTPRYVIDVKIMVTHDKLLLVPQDPVGKSHPAVRMLSPISNDDIKMDGLDILIIYEYHQYQGTLYPVPEPADDSLR